MKRSLLALSLSSALLLAGCGATVPILQQPAQQVSAPVDANVIHEAILKASTLRHWKLVADKPGVVTLAYPSGPKAEHFQSTYNIEYDAHTYRIKYISSYGLDENIGCPSAQDRASSTCAHRNVNNWQIKLGRDIARVLDQRAAPSAVK